MRLKISLLLMLTLVLPALAQDAPVNVTEDYLLLQIHRNFASRMDVVWDFAWNWCGGSSDIVDSSNWVEHKTIEVTRENHGMQFGFADIGYDPELSAFKYGTATATTNEQLLTGHDYLYDLRGSAQDGKFKQTDEVTLEDTRSVEISHGIVMNVSVENEAKISGSYAGIGLEDTIKTTFGFQKSEEEKRAQSESKSVTQSHEFSIPLPAAQITRISLTTGQTHTDRPLSIDGVATWTAEFWIGQGCAWSPNWWDKAGYHIFSKDNPQVWDCWKDAGGNYPTNQGQPRLFKWFSHFATPCKVSVPLDEIEAMFRGHHADWQGMVGLWDKLPAVAKNALNAALDPINRTVMVSGLEKLVSDHEIDEVVTPVHASDVDDILAAGAKKCHPESSTC